MVSAAAFAEQQESTIISGSSDFHARLFDQGFFLDPSGAKIEAASIHENRYEHLFKKNSDRIPFMFNDQKQWLRFSFENSEHRTVELVIYNIFLFAEADFILVSQTQREHSRLGFKYQEFIGEGSIFPATRMRFPPGHSTLYIGINTHRLPIPSSFEIAGLRQFETVKNGRSLLFFSVISVGIGFLVYNFLLFAMIRSRLYGYYVLAIISSLYYWGILSGVISIFGREFVAAILPHWVYSAFYPTGTCGLFMIEYFETGKAKNRRLHLGLLLASLNCLAMPFFYQLYWRFMIPVIWVSMFFVFITGSIVIYQDLWQNPKRALSFIIPFWPLLIACSCYLISLYLGHDGDAFFMAQTYAALFNITTLSLVIGNRTNEEQRIRHAFEVGLKSVMSPRQIKRIMNHDVMLDTTAVSKRVTIIFVDIVGYSLSLRRLSSSEAFWTLKEKLSQLTHITHKYDGVIDKSLGDGCLCFFGYDMVGGSYGDHEQIAVECALEMQRATIESSLGTHGYIYPIRIGINTAEVYIGNMGDDSRFDFTMCGNGVVLANRLEAACEPFKILIGAETYEGLSEEFKNGMKFYPRLISIKHQEQLQTCYEIDPLLDHRATSRLVRDAFWKNIEQVPQAMRYKTQPGTLHFGSSFGPLEILDYSKDGYRLLSPVFLGKNVIITLHLTGLARLQHMTDIDEIGVKVIWGTPLDDQQGFKLGVKIFGLSEKQKNRIFTLLHSGASLNEMTG
jgi:class 3 adenylate cyclase